MKTTAVIKNKLLSIAGVACMVFGVLLLDHMVAAGIFSVAGLLLLIAGGLSARSGSDCITAGILLWLGYAIRYCGVFGSKTGYTAMVALLLIIPCGIMFLGILAARKIRCTKYALLSVLIVPAIYAAIAQVLEMVSMGVLTNLTTYVMCIPYFSICLSQMGEYGMTFVIMIALCCIAEVIAEMMDNGRSEEADGAQDASKAVQRTGAGKNRQKTGIVCASVSIIIVIALLLTGVLLSGRIGEPDYTLKIALATAQEMDFIGEGGKYYNEDEQMEMFRIAIDEAVQDGAALLVLNEEYFMWNRDREEELCNHISELARDHHIPVLAGIDLLGEEIDINEAVYVDADGNLVSKYIKSNLVPFVEAGSYYDGKEAPESFNTVIDGHDVRMAYMICFDLNNEGLLRKLRDDVDLVLVPSWDWDNVNIEQKRTYARAAIPGATLVKHTYDGYSYVSSPEGRCSTMIDLRKDYEDVVTIDVPVWEK